MSEIGFYKYKETKSGVEYAILRKQDKFSAKRGLKKTKPCNDVKANPDSPFAVLRELNLQR